MSCSVDHMCNEQHEMWCIAPGVAQGQPEGKQLAGMDAGPPVQAGDVLALVVATPGDCNQVSSPGKHQLL